MDHGAYIIIAMIMAWPIGPLNREQSLCNGLYSKPVDYEIIQSQAVLMATVLYPTRNGLICYVDCK